MALPSINLTPTGGGAERFYGDTPPPLFENVGPALGYLPALNHFAGQVSPPHFGNLGQIGFGPPMPPEGPSFGGGGNPGGGIHWFGPGGSGVSYPVVGPQFGLQSGPQEIRPPVLGPALGADHNQAQETIGHLLSAIQAARDPELKSSLSTALATVQKYAHGIHKEHQQMLQGKISPRLMHEAYTNHAPYGEVRRPIVGAQ